jgi:tRNA threonylcarbamoyladenosine biosynthesis protein TsaE
MILPDETATHAAGVELSDVLRVGDVVALFGDLGAGKTSFARGVLAGLGLAEEAPSPSYPLIIPYDPPLVRLPVWHVDLYRLDGPDDCIELGLDEALQEGALLIEWPERLGDQLWKNALHLRFDRETSGGRTLTVTVPPSWEGRCPLS